MPEEEKRAQPRELSEGERVKKVKVVEDVDLFDEVFEGKKERHVEVDESLPSAEKNVKALKKPESRKNEPERTPEAEEDFGGAGKKEEKEEPKENEKGLQEKGGGEKWEDEPELKEDRKPEGGDENDLEEPEKGENEPDEGEKEPEKEKKKQLLRKEEKINNLKRVKVKKKSAKDSVKGMDDEIAEEFKGVPSKEEIKEKLVEKASKAAGTGPEMEPEQDNTVPLRFLEDKENQNVFIGMKRGVFNSFGGDQALLVGKLKERGEGERNVFLDSLNPHVVFVCGARGSGKSYVLGVIAEEMAHKNPDVGMLVIDPIGVFWSMRHPNRETRELEALGKWGLEPKGVENLKVFIPEGMKNSVPGNTFDSTFSIPPSLLTSEDWSLTFGMERFGPTGLLLDKLLKKVEHGYTTEEGKNVKGKKGSYSLNDMIHCLENDADLNSRERGYKMDSIRALVSRFEAAKGWGIFSEKGTPLSELSRAGQLSILDTSFLEENVTSLVIGIIARRILAARKLSTRREAADKFKSMEMDELLELEIPPTWLFVDEAHTLIPSGTTKTPATSALVEYVKQGRRPGCSVVFATQQPSAIDTKVLSQLDVLLCHKLVFDDDIKAVFKRIPTIIPWKYKKSNFIRSLPIGTTLTGDRREETSRAFVMKIRPRMSQHEGRDAETLQKIKSLSPEQVENLAKGMILKKVEAQGELEMPTLNQLVETLSSKYKAKAQLSNVLDLLEESGLSVDDKRVFLSGEEEGEPEEDEEEEEEEMEGGEPEVYGEENEAAPKSEAELLVFAPKIDAKMAEKIAGKSVDKKFLFFGAKEKVKEVKLVHRKVYKIEFNEFNTKSEYLPRACYVDSFSGELLHFVDGAFVLSKGFSRTSALNADEMRVLKYLVQHKKLPARIDRELDLNETKVKTVLDRLAENNFVKKESKNKVSTYYFNNEVELPLSASHSVLSSLDALSLTQQSSVEAEPEVFERTSITKTLNRFFPNTVVKRIKELYRPVYKVLLSGEKERLVHIDAVSGKTI